MIGRILPRQVCWAEAWWHDDPAADLFPEEQAVVARAVAKRRAEFATVRHCARDALRELGHPPMPLHPGDRGAPIWPPGIVGSMTHCDQYRSAAVARVDNVVTVGIDAEPCQPLPDGVLAIVSCAEERETLNELSNGEAAWDRVLFSAKESIYKAWFPLTHTFLEFQEAVLTVREDGTFTAQLLVDPPLVKGQRLSTFAGKWLVERGVVVTSVVVLA